MIAGSSFIGIGRQLNNHRRQGHYLSFFFNRGLAKSAGIGRCHYNRVLLGRIKGLSRVDFLTGASN